MAIIKNCIVCNIEFKVSPSNGKAKYCSRKCRSEERKFGLIKNCLTCNTLITGRNIKKRRFCSHKCAYINFSLEGSTIKVCIICKNSFKHKQYKEERIYCSVNCASTSRTSTYKEEQRIHTNLNSLIDNLEPVELDLSDKQIENIFNLSTLPEDIDSYYIIALKK